MRLRSYLLILALAVLLPALVLAAALIAWNAGLNREVFARGLTDTAEALSLAVDREFAAIAQAAQALGTSPTLPARDLAGFHAHAGRLRELNPEWNSIALMEPSGQQLVNLLRPPGTPLHSIGHLPEFRQAVTTGRLVITGVLDGVAAGTKVIAVDVPIFADGKLAWVVGVTMRLAQFAALLRERDVPASWNANIVDPAGIIVARAVDAEGLTGTPLPPPTLAGLRSGPEGFFPAVRGDGTPIYVAFHHSAVTGWTTMLTVPRAEVEAAARQAWLAGGTASALAVGLAALLALLGGRFLARAVGRLADAARAVSAGQEVAAGGAMPISEFATVEAALREAGALRREREAAEIRLRVEAARREAEERFRVAQELSLDAFTILDAVRDAAGRIVDFAWVYANPAAHRLLQAAPGELVGQRLLVRLPGNRTGSDLFDSYVQVVETGVPHDQELRYEADGIAGWFRNTAVRLGDGVAVCFRDITARKQAEEQRELVLAELDHRIKNLLSVVGSIAALSLADARPLAEAREAFTRRLKALAATQELLTATHRAGLGLGTLVEAELAPYDGRARIDGPELLLGPKVAQTLGLALHELATNAAKHGALSAAEGRVTIGWRITGEAGARMLRFTWREQGGPAVAPPDRQGFGRMLVERVVPRELNGRGRLEFAAAGVSWELEAPLDRLGR